MSYKKSSHLVCSIVRGDSCNRNADHGNQGLSEVKSIITAILSIGQVQGDETCLAGWLLCSVLYFVFLLIREIGQTRASVKYIVFWCLAAECSSDLIRAVVIHYGIAAVYGLILWPFLVVWCCPAPFQWSKHRMFCQSQSD